MTTPVTVASIFRRSNFGESCYIVRNDPGCALPDADSKILEALLAAGACSASHWGMYQPVRRATALPRGSLFEMVRAYAFGDLPERS